MKGRRGAAQRALPAKSLKQAAWRYGCAAYDTETEKRALEELLRLLQREWTEMMTRRFGPL